jgi:chaperonin GroES
MFRCTIAKYAKTLTPLGDRVLVKRVMPAKETKSGILIPEQVAGKVNEGTVVAVAAAGKGKKDAFPPPFTPTVKVGDTVLLPDFGGNSVKLEGEEFHLFSEAALLGIVSSA